MGVGKSGAIKNPKQPDSWARNCDEARRGARVPPTQEKPNEGRGGGGGDLKKVLPGPRYC